jgi:hypothetical protein
VTTNTSVNVPCVPPSMTAALEGEKDYPEWHAIKALCARATLEVLGLPGLGIMPQRMRADRQCDARRGLCQMGHAPWQSVIAAPRFRGNARRS